MATLTAVIVPAKVLKGGRHKIRISVAHNGETRYIVTDIVIDSEKEFKSGSVVKRNDAAILNTKLRGLLQRYQEAIDSMSYTNGLTCAELVFEIKNSSNKKHRTLQSIYEEFMATRKIKQSSRRVYEDLWIAIKKHLNERMFVNNVTYATILNLDKALHSLKTNPATVRNRMMFFLSLLRYASRCGYAQFRQDPTLGYTLPAVLPRQSWLSVDEVRRIRDMELQSPKQTRCRDLFMLSYYLGGINMIDLASINFNENTDKIQYIRKKTEDRPKINKYVEFEIPEEAKAIITKYKKRDGCIMISKSGSVCSNRKFIEHHMQNLAKITGIERLVFYSARKSFSQHAFELGINTSVIDYILGHKVDKGGTSLFAYIYVTPEKASLAVRQVLDNLK